MIPAHFSTIAGADISGRADAAAEGQAVVGGHHCVGGLAVAVLEFAIPGAGQGIKRVGKEARAEAQHGLFVECIDGAEVRQDALGAVGQRVVGLAEIRGAARYRDAGRQEAVPLAVDMPTGPPARTRA